MAKNKGAFVWGVLLGALATAIAVCGIMSRSCKTFPFPAGPAPAKDSAKPAPKRKATKVRRAASKRK